MTQATSMPADQRPELDFSPVRDDLPMRLQRKLRLAPAVGLGVGRRAVFFALFTWLPIAVWGAMVGRALPGVSPEPLLEHFSVQVICLVAIPLMILCEAVTHTIAQRIGGQFLSSGLVIDAQREQFAEIIRNVARLRNASLLWAFVLGAAIALSAEGSPSASHAISWALEDRNHLGFGGWWFLCVARPIYIALVLGWLWRLALVSVLLFRISKLDLSLVPTHPDRTGGMGFLVPLPAAFALWTMAIASVIASQWAHQLLYHGATIDSFKLPLVVFVITMCVLVLAPLFVFLPRLSAMKRDALLNYGALVGEHGRLTRKRWILGEQLDNDAVLNAAELGAVADTATMYDAVTKIRAVPIAVSSLVLVLVPILLPLMIAASTQVPIRAMLLKLLKMIA